MCFCVACFQLIQFIRFNAVLCPAGRHFWLDFRFYKVLGREPPTRYRVIKPAHCRVQKFPRVSCYKTLFAVPKPSQEGPGGALCGVLTCGNIVCRLCAGTRHKGGKRGAVGLVSRRAVLSVPCSTVKNCPPGGRLTRAGPGHSRQRVTVRGCGPARVVSYNPPGPVLSYAVSIHA